ncbi:23S rRNA (pseudouridine1915-N3)-methyltransferase [Lachnospiraceae bacterium C7]|nr:23S rRNA (pseudouridine1915-N3)-methyltransferase [Lachnospiraceae bacterium C7]
MLNYDYNINMKISIICVGKVKEKFYRDAIAEYSKRLSRYAKLEVIEVADEKTKDNASDNEIDIVKNTEGERILKAIKDDSGYIICLAIDGKQLDSVELANKINKLGISGTSHIYLIIGGSLGLSDEVLKKADFKLSFSKMTFPHQLMRVVLLEQIYRSYRIINHEPYHK